MFPPPEIARRAPRGDDLPRFALLHAGRGRGRTAPRGGAAAQAGGRGDGSAPLFLAAGRLAPRSHLPSLLLGGIEAPAAAIEALSRAEALNPMSCHAAYLRGVRLLEVGDVADAAAAFERARAIAPTFGAPQERLGMLAEAAGRTDDACRLFEEAALQNPTFALPIARLAEIAQRTGKIDKAVGLLERILGDDPDLVADQFPDRPRLRRAAPLPPGAPAPAARGRRRRGSGRGAHRPGDGGTRPRQPRRREDRPGRSRRFSDPG